MYHLIDKEMKGAIVRDYVSGDGIDVVAERYKVSSQTVRRFVRAAGERVRTMSEGRREYAFDENVFNQVTEESAYWTGMLMADGSVVEEKSRSPRICLGLATKDIGHVYKFRSFLKSNHPVKERMMGSGPVVKAKRPYPLSYFTVRSLRLAESLRNYGVVPNKVYRTKASSELEKNRHFWRGMVDGDGSISVSRKDVCPVPSVTLLGSENILIQFMSFVRSSGIATTTKIYPKGKIFQAVIPGRYAVLLADLLYKNVSIALERKRRLALEVSALRHKYTMKHGLCEALTA
jgi:hypothetical protein